LAAGVQLLITTNFEPILTFAQKSFEERIPSHREEMKEVQVRFWVDETSHSGKPKSKPFFRGLDHLVFAGFDTRNSLLVNLREHCGIGRFTPELASDAKFWESILFPALLTILGPSVGLTPLHCACVAWRGSGLILAGESGAGKSTLSLALAQSGFDFLSDDRTLIGEQQGRLLAWALSKEMKQRIESLRQFPYLSQLKLNGTFKREDEFRFDASKVPGIHCVRCCEPRWLVFLERQPQPTFSLTYMPPDEAAWRLECQLHRETPDARERQRRAIDNLVTGKCFRLKYGGDSHVVAGALRSLVANGWKADKPLSQASSRKLLQSAPGCDDPLRRFRATSLHCEASLMGRRIRLETNVPVVLKRAAGFLNCDENTSNAPSQFLWKIVVEQGDRAKAVWPPMTAFSNESLRYINLGQRSFIAVDHRSRQAVGVIPDYLADDEAGFSSVFLASMLYLTAPALGLVAISAACVAMEGRGLLLFGSPCSGKTTASYRSISLGLEFYADQALFMEGKDGSLRAWGDFWPAAFREDAAKFLSELAHQSQRLVYVDRTFLCVGKNPTRSSGDRSVIPVGCIFLHRQAGTSPKLDRLRQRDVSGRLAAFVPFVENAGSTSERDEVFKSLNRLPAYTLTYGSDTSEAAVFLRSILSTHHPLEDRS
jgi:hypothetical protein